MPPRMRTRSAVRLAAESLRGGTGERIGRGGRGRRPREGNDKRVEDSNGQGNFQGLGADGGVKGVNGNVEGANGGAPEFSTIIAQQMQNLLLAMLAQVSNQGNARNKNGSSYKEFLACNPKEYDGKGGAVVLTRWIEKMESAKASREVVVSMSWNDFKFMMIQEFCPSQRSRVGNRVVESLPRMVAATEPKTMQKVVQISSALTDEAVRNGSIKKVEKRGNVGEPSKDRSGRDDNKRTRTGNVFATTVKPCRKREYGYLAQVYHLQLLPCT
ncbi:hypothetical protein Tco_1492800 [Tanacetum coccineum]